MAKTPRPRRSRQAATQKDEPPDQHKLATKVDAAMKAVEVARVALDTATQEHTAAAATLTAAHTEYQAFMDNVLSVGGTVHVAKP